MRYLTADALTLVHGGLDSPNTEHNTAAETILSVVALNLRKRTMRLPEEAEQHMKLLESLDDDDLS